MHCAKVQGFWMETSTSFLWHITEEVKEPAIEKLHLCYNTF